MLTNQAQPLVSCLLLTADRRQFLPGAIRRFLEQDYANRELLVIDDGHVPSADLIPEDPKVRYIRLAERMTVGAKRNRGCREARGELIAHWDDDDWMASWRLGYQVREMLKFDVDLSGLRQLYFWGPRAEQAWEYAYEAESQPWVAGGTMMYRRSLWEKKPFDEVNVGEDNSFVWSEVPKTILPLVDRRFYVAGIHSGNTSPKMITPERWHPAPLDEIQQVIGEEWAAYGKLLFGAPAKMPAAAAEPAGQESFTFFAAARRGHMVLPEVAAFLSGKILPWMRQWELPFAIFQARLTETMTVLDCSINPCDLGRWLGELYPFTLYRHANPLAQGRYLMPPAAPDASFDRVFCLNTLEHFAAPQREELMAVMASKLKPGGQLVVTVDHYFESSWANHAWLATGLMRADREEVPNGFNRVTPADLASLCARSGLEPLAPVVEAPREGDPGLYLNPPPLEHGAIGAVFSKGTLRETSGRRVLLALLTWNTREVSLESLAAHVREAGILRRLGHEPYLCVVDNGSTDGTAEELRRLDGALGVPHKFILNAENIGNSRARNQIIDHMLECGADYVIFVDGDIEVVPFSTFVMLRYMESAGGRLGCLGAHSFSCTPERKQTTPSLYSLANCQMHSSDTLAWTQYGIFRRKLFEDGVRFDESGPFGEPGHGLEDVDLAFQIFERGYLNHYFSGMSYLHRNLSSSVGILSSQGMEPTERYYQRKEYLIRKWEGVPAISNGPLNWVRQARAPWSEVRTGKMSSVRMGAGCPDIPVPGEVMDWVDRSVSDMLDRAELMALAAILATHDWRLSSFVVEIGAYIGSTTVFLAKVAELLGSHPQILSIDPFERCQPDNLNPQGHYQAYVDNILEHGVGNCCFALAAFSADVASSVRDGIGILVIDGAHHYEAVSKDLELYVPKVVPGGYVFLDDYGPSYPDVMRAIDEYLPAHPEMELVVKSYYVILRRRS